MDKGESAARARDPSTREVASLAPLTRNLLMRMKIAPG
jgi:hypothetical protein